MRVLLDNGHGINTPGKKSPVWPDGSMLSEWRYTRELTTRIEAALKEHRIPVQRIVPEFRDIPLWERCHRVNKIAATIGSRHCLLVSVHVNASANGKAYGWEIHTSKGQLISDICATVFWSEASAQLEGHSCMRGDHSDGDPDWDSDFAILRDTICPAVLTENLFMDNAEDCKFLLSEAGKQKMVDLHVQSILQVASLPYFNT
jgi:N-acetylmuramoyl-L-alanine amidase